MDQLRSEQEEFPLLEKQVNWKEPNSNRLISAMAEPEVRISAGAAEETGDVEMQGGDDVVEVGETGADDAPGEDVEEETALETQKAETRVTFVE